MVYLLSAVLFGISIFNIETPIGKEHLLCKWTLLIAVAIIILAIKIGREYHWSLGVLLAYVGISAAYNIVYPMNNYYTYDDVARLVIAFSSSKALIALIATVFIISLIKLEDIEKLSSFFIIITLLNSAIVVYQWVNGNLWYLRGGLFDNVSINGCIIASCYPLLLDSKCLEKIKSIELRIVLALICLSLPVVAIICAMSSVGVGVLAVAISVYAFARTKNMFFRIAVPVVLFASVIMLGYLTNPKEMFKDSNRLDLYKIQYDAWDKQGQYLLGYGTGTYRYFGTKTQVETKFMLSKKEGDYRGSYNLWLHNDWLQLLLENGIIGMILILISTLFTVFYAWKIPHMFACLIAYMSSMLFHYPIHYPIHALFGVWIIAYVYLKHKAINQESLILKGANS